MGFLCQNLKTKRNEDFMFANNLGSVNRRSGMVIRLFKIELTQIYTSCT